MGNNTIWSSDRSATVIEPWNGSKTVATAPWRRPRRARFAMGTLGGCQDTKQNLTVSLASIFSSTRIIANPNEEPFSSAFISATAASTPLRIKKQQHDNPDKEGLTATFDLDSNDPYDFVRHLSRAKIDCSDATEMRSDGYCPRIKLCFEVLMKTIATRFISCLSRTQRQSCDSIAP